MGPIFHETIVCTKSLILNSKIKEHGRSKLYDVGKTVFRVQTHTLTPPLLSSMEHDSDRTLSGHHPHSQTHYVHTNKEVLSASMTNGERPNFENRRVSSTTSRSRALLLLRPPSTPGPSQSHPRGERPTFDLTNRCVGSSSSFGSPQKS